MGSRERGSLILAHAAELFAQKGIAATTVRDIASRAGILSGSLYHYFPSKDAMADAILTRYLGNLVDEYERIVRAGFEPRRALLELALVSSHVSGNHAHASEIYQRETEYLRRLPSADEIRDAARTIRKTWMDALQQGISDGTLRADLPIELLYLLVRDAVWLTLHAAGGAVELADDQLAEAVISVFLDGATASALTRAEA